LTRKREAMEKYEVQSVRLMSIVRVSRAWSARPRYGRLRELEEARTMTLPQLILQVSAPRGALSRPTRLPPARESQYRRGVRLGHVEKGADAADVPRPRSELDRAPEGILGGLCVRLREQRKTWRPVVFSRRVLVFSAGWPVMRRRTDFRILCGALNAPHRAAIPARCRRRGSSTYRRTPPRPSWAALGLATR